MNDVWPNSLLTMKPGAMLIGMFCENAKKESFVEKKFILSLLLPIKSSELSDDEPPHWSRGQSFDQVESRFFSLPFLSSSCPGDENTKNGI